MKRTIFLAVGLATLLCALTGFAQPDTVWTRTYDWGGWSTFRADDGGFLLLARRNSGSGSDDTLLVTKLSSTGDSLWSVPIASEGYVGYSSAATMLTNGNILVVTDSAYESLDVSDNRCYILNQLGEMVVEREISDSLGYLTAAATPDGGALLSAVLPSGADVDMVVQKLDNQANVEWTHVYGDSAFGERGLHVSVDDEGRFLVTTLIQGFDGDFYRFDYHATLFDSNGDSLWSRPLTQELWSLGWWAGSAPTQDGFIVYGRFEGMVDDSAVTAPWAIKYDLNGDSIWSRTISGVASYTSVSSVAMAIDGGVVVVGSQYDGVFWAKFDAAGELLWHVIAGPESLAVRSHIDILRVADDGYILTKSFIQNEIGRTSVTRTSPDLVAISPSPDLPVEFALHPNHPNPFNATTEISFDLPRAMDVSLRVYDVLGREAAVLADGMQAAGTHALKFDASTLASGVYFYRLEAGRYFETRKMVLLK